MGRKMKNEVGNRYGRLTVIKRYPEKSCQGALWLCRCECGSEFVVSGVKLRSGNTRSCGCLREMTVAERAKNGFGPNGKERFVVA